MFAKDVGTGQKKEAKMPVGTATPKDIANVIITAKESHGIPVVDKTKPEGVAVLKGWKHRRLAQSDDGSPAPTFGRITKALCGERSIAKYLSYRADSNGALNTLLQAYEKEMKARYGSMSESIMSRAKDTFKDISNVSTGSIEKFESAAYSQSRQVESARQSVAQGLVDGTFSELLGTPSSESVKIMMNVVQRVDLETAGYEKLTDGEKEFVGKFFEAVLFCKDNDIRLDYRLENANPTHSNYANVKREIANDRRANKEDLELLQSAVCEVIAKTQPRFGQSSSGAVKDPVLKEVNVPFNQKLETAEPDRAHTEKLYSGITRSISFSSLVEVAEGVPNERVHQSNSPTDLEHTIEELDEVVSALYEGEKYDFSGVTVTQLHRMNMQLESSRAEDIELKTLLLLDGLPRKEAFSKLASHYDEVQRQIAVDEQILLKSKEPKLVVAHNALLTAKNNDAETGKVARSVSNQITGLKKQLARTDNLVRQRQIRSAIAHERRRLSALSAEKSDAAMAMFNAMTKFEEAVASPHVTSQEREAVRNMKSFDDERKSLVALDRLQGSIADLASRNRLDEFAKNGASILSTLYQGDGFILSGADDDKISAIRAGLSQMPVEAFGQSGTTAVEQMKNSACFAHLDERAVRVDKLFDGAVMKMQKQVPASIQGAVEERERAVAELIICGGQSYSAYKKIQTLEHQYRAESSSAVRENLEEAIEAAKGEATTAQKAFEEQYSVLREYDKVTVGILKKADPRDVALIERVGELRAEQVTIRELIELRKVTEEVAQELGV